MSGKKESEVTPFLEKAEESVREQMDTIRKNTSSLPTGNVLNGLSGELANAESVIKSQGGAESRSMIQESRRLFEKGAALDAEADRLSQAAQRKMDEVRSEIRRIRKKINDVKRETGHDWYLDQEFEDAGAAKKKSEQALKECKQAFKKKREALDSYKEARSKLTQATAKQKEEAAKAAARAFLKSSMDEIGHEDVDELDKWTHAGDTYRSILNDLNAVESLIASGQCEQAEAEIRRLTEEVRKLKDLMDENKAKSKLQVMKAKAVIAALKAMNYDEPDYYYKDELPSGDGDPISDLIVYAANPAGGADIRLTITIDNKMGLEMFRHDAAGNEIEVSQADGIKCHKTIQELQGRMAQDGYKMDMTNWGNATTVEGGTPPKQRPPQEQEQTIVRG